MAEAARDQQRHGAREGFRLLFKLWYLKQRKCEELVA